MFLLITLVLAPAQAPVHKTTQEIEKAFLQNDAAALSQHFKSTGSIIISFPDPIAFSDQMSHQQAHFLFKKIFHSYTTLEFYSINEVPANPDQEEYFFKGRWSFRNKTNKNLYVYHLYFYIAQEKTGKRSTVTHWKILEIKADKI
ncbi:MAG: hypothetical protein JXB26_04780 [Candidatus Aminicenantes bacterium]|nr:hypothetical protein [Candidatus Aminicenantes bacterium]